MNRATTITIALTGLAVAAASACAGDSTTPASSSTAGAPIGVTSTTARHSATAPETSAPTATAAASSPMVGGMTECTKEALAQPATQAAQALGAANVYTVRDLTCADGWAVTSGLLAGKDNPTMGAPTSFVFEQEGQFWIPKQKSKVCGTNPTATTPPPDAVIPGALFLAGCAAG